MKKCFTLLELMIAVFVLTLIAGSIGVKAVELIKKARFHHSLKIIREEIEKLQLLALTYSSDMSCSFSCNASKEWSLRTEVNEAFLSRLDRKTLNLKEITKISWCKESVKDPLFIQISYNGDMKPHGILQIEGKTEKYFLDFRRPFLLTLSHNLPLQEDFKEPSPPLKLN